MTEAVADPIPNNVAISNSDRVVCASILDSPLDGAVSTVEDKVTSSENKHSDAPLSSINSSTVFKDKVALEGSINNLLYQSDLPIDVSGSHVDFEEKMSSRSSNDKLLEQSDLPLADIVGHIGFQNNMSSGSSNNKLLEQNDPSDPSNIGSEKIVSSKNNNDKLEQSALPIDGVCLVGVKKEMSSDNKDEKLLEHNDPTLDGSNCPMFSDGDNLFEHTDLPTDDIGFEKKNSSYDNDEKLLQDTDSPTDDVDLEDNLDDEPLGHSVKSVDFKNYLTLVHEIDRNEENLDFHVSDSLPKPTDVDFLINNNSGEDGSSGRMKHSGMTDIVDSEDFRNYIGDKNYPENTSIKENITVSNSADIGCAEAIISKTTPLTTTVDHNGSHEAELEMLTDKRDNDDDSTDMIKSITDSHIVQTQSGLNVNEGKGSNSEIPNCPIENGIHGDLSHQKKIKCEQFNNQVSVESVDDRNIYNENQSSRLDSTTSESVTQTSHHEIKQRAEDGCKEYSSHRQGTILCACGELLIDDLNEGEFSESFNQYEGEFHEEFDDYHVEGFQNSHSKIVTFTDKDNLQASSREQTHNTGLLQSQLDQTEKETNKKEEEYLQEIAELRKENERQQKLIGQNLTLGPQAKIEATMQHEITRMTSENLDLREVIDKQTDQIRKLKKMLRVYSKKLKDGEAAEIQAEIEQEERSSRNDQLATVKHRERNYMGMLEYRKEDEGALIKNLILDLKPKIAFEMIPGLPAYILFMCVRHTDYTNDDEKVRSLLTATINSIKKVVKKHNDDVERVTMWLANTCRLLHTLKQYSGEKAFQTENSTKQNEQNLRNFDLSEYRQVFSDLAVWIYQSLIKSMEECTQPNIVPAVLEHEAIAGLTASKPSGLRGRTSSNAQDLEDKEYSLDSLMKALNNYMRILTQHAVDPELVKQIFRQLYYFICAGALNNLLLRKDMCNWSKGMQIRYNLSHLEQWLRDNKLHESGAVATLEPIVQASQLLQARKTVVDVDGICEMCSKLTVAQIVKILNLYTPVDEFEERVPISFIRKIQDKLRHRSAENNALLIETTFNYPVTFPFNPSSIALETITVPEQLHLGFLKKI